MILYSVEIEKSGVIYSYKQPEDIFDLIESISSNEEAVEISSWAELAGVGEMYYGEGFNVEVVED